MVPADEAERRKPHRHPFGNGRPYLLADRRADARQYPGIWKQAKQRGAADEPPDSGAALIFSSFRTIFLR